MSNKQLTLPNFNQEQWDLIHLFSRCGGCRKYKSSCIDESCVLWEAGCKVIFYHNLPSGKYIPIEEKVEDACKRLMRMRLAEIVENE